MFTKFINRYIGATKSEQTVVMLSFIGASHVALNAFKSFSPQPSAHLLSLIVWVFIFLSLNEILTGVFNFAKDRILNHLHRKAVRACNKETMTDREYAMWSVLNAIKLIGPFLYMSTVGVIPYIINAGGTAGSGIVTDEDDYEDDYEDAPVSAPAKNTGGSSGEHSRSVLEKARERSMEMLIEKSVRKFKSKDKLINQYSGANMDTRSIDLSGNGYSQSEAEHIANEVESRTIWVADRISSRIIHFKR